MRPAHLLVVSYVGAILVGTVLLSIPVSWGDGAHVNLLDAVFTATSAVCVTGLIVKNTGADFSWFGQSVILLLIQIGGLGLMTFSTFFVYLMGKRVAIRERVLVRETFGDLLSDTPKAFVTAILKMTLFIEAIGAILLYFRFAKDFSAGKAAFRAVFHSISAFCNAGFSLFTTSFMDYQNDVWVVSVIVSLIVVGGLGFLVLADIMRHPWRKLRADRRPLTLHTRMVLTVTAALLVVGGAACFFLEMNNTLAGSSPRTRVLSAIFLSVTSRTAGFNTLDTSSLTSATLFVVMILMFIGASPGSTGGGIKTTTFGIIWAMARSRLRGQRVVNVFRRTIPENVTNGTLAVLAASISAVLVFLLALLIAECGLAGAGKEAFRNVAFETLSAFGTVGLSTGITPSLSVGGRVLIIMLMLIGRIGPLTLVMTLAGNKKRAAYEHPREPLMIG